MHNLLMILKKLDDVIVATSACHSSGLFYVMIHLNKVQSLMAINYIFVFLNLLLEDAYCYKIYQYMFRLQSLELQCEISIKITSYSRYQNYMGLTF